MEWLSSKIDAALAWIGALFSDAIAAVLQMLTDAAISILELFLGGVLFVVGSLPVPDFLVGGMQGFLNGIDGSVLYFLSRSGFGPALALVGTGFAFRMLRKLFTLGQW